ncbi:conserved hypothetical protein [Ricinus communis]|uniref:Uncharacterized protein n=1 Tax=Ricinus communis TaxID=3988 RepID=B9THS3_RICCO|nr:conserved hypothetical protein [Ricinus communis]
MQQSVRGVRRASSLHVERVIAVRAMSVRRHGHPMHRVFPRGQRGQRDRRDARLLRIDRRFRGAHLLARCIRDGQRTEGGFERAIEGDGHPRGRLDGRARAGLLLLRKHMGQRRERHQRE